MDNSINLDSEDDRWEDFFGKYYLFSYLLWFVNYRQQNCRDKI